MCLPPLGVAAAHQLLIHHAAPAALGSVSVMEAPAAAELAAPRRVRRCSAAAVAQPHRDPSPRGVRTAGLICKDKDGKNAGGRAGFVRAEKVGGETRLTAGGTHRFGHERGILRSTGARAELGEVFRCSTSDRRNYPKSGNRPRSSGGAASCCTTVRRSKPGGIDSFAEIRQTHAIRRYQTSSSLII